jgi:RHS repeat-associated protein
LTDTVPFTGAADVIGQELATNSVTVNSVAPYRKGEYFRQQVSVANSSVPVWQSINVAAPNESTITGNIFVPKTQEAFTYDLDGNLTADGRWNYSWDAENRLLSMVANTAVGPQQSIKFEYDSKGRRIGKKVWPNLNFNNPPSLEQKFLYDGWNLIGVLNSSFALQTSFYWGTDLSGALQGAGGVGGLLEINDIVNGVHFIGYDANGNVALLARAADGTAAAQYEYGPFGEVIRATGPMAKANPFRFSTKYQDDETDLLYYGYRYYNASTGRWITRDPTQELNGPNVFAFSSNDGIGAFDALGLSGLHPLSFGIAYANGPVWPWGTFERDGGWSGQQQSLDAWYYQTLKAIKCPGGLCNSGIYGDSSSFVAAWIGNDDKCPVKLKCSCQINANGSTFVPKGASTTGAKKLGGLSTKGHVLNKTFYIRAYPQDIGNGWEANLGFSIDAEEEFVLKPGARKDLYHGHIDVSVGPHPGSTINEAMNGTCSCTQE